MMTINAECLKVDGTRVAIALQQACEKLAGAGGELALDFSGVRRVDASALKAMEQLAGLAEAKSRKVVLHGVDVDVYKVLKLVNLASKFDFRD
jgi:anti-anti-sigma regulatory factor